MEALPTLKIVHSDGFCLINEADFDPEMHELLEDSGNDPSFLIAAKRDGVVVLWNGSEFTSKSSNKTYSSEESAEGAIARTKAIQNAIAEKDVADVVVIRA